MKPLLIFSGSNDRAVVSFCRFCVSREINFYIIANGTADLIFLSKYKSNVIFTREKNKLSISDLLHYTALVKEHSNTSEVVILPSTEFINRLLLRNIHFLTENNIFTGLCSPKLYETLSDKYSFGILCAQYDINVPKEYDTIPRKYPFIIKPKSYQDSTNLIDKPAIINTAEEAKNYLSSKPIEDYFFQEYVGGQSIYLLYNFSAEGNYSVYSQENFLQQSNGGSMLVSKSSLHHKNIIAEKFATMFKNEGFAGLIMVEVKLYQDNYYMIEANPRLWGPSQLILDAGMDLFDTWALDQGLISQKYLHTYKNDVYYFWEGGLTIEKESAKELKYYNKYDELIFTKQYSQLQKTEIYNRTDTVGIYKKENKK